MTFENISEKIKLNPDVEITKDKTFSSSGECSPSNLNGRGLAGPATGISRTSFFLFFSLKSKYLFLHPKETPVKIVFSWVFFGG